MRELLIWTALSIPVLPVLARAIARQREVNAVRRRAACINALVAARRPGSAIVKRDGS